MSWLTDFLRDNGCSRCKQVSSGDCGSHGSRIYTPAIVTAAVIIVPRRKQGGPDD